MISLWLTSRGGGGGGGGGWSAVLQGVKGQRLALNLQGQEPSLGETASKSKAKQEQSKMPSALGHACNSMERGGGGGCRECGGGGGSIRSTPTPGAAGFGARLLLSWEDGMFRNS